MNNREIDALVAEKVMGWQKSTIHKGFWVTLQEDGCEFHHAAIAEWNPQKNIAFAWRVVEKWDELGWHWEIASGKSNIHVVVLTDNDDLPSTYGYLHRGIAPTAPLAICLAALEACGIELPAAGNDQEGV